MILNERKKPLEIQKLETLIRRLPDRHPKMKQIQAELARRKAGYRGEQSLDYHLTFLDQNKYLILHGLRLANEENRHFQIDTLILSPRFFLISEVKNISGTLYFNSTTNQVIRILNGKEEAFSDPILQANRQQLQLQSWIVKNKLPQIPIVELVVNSNPTTIIRTDPQNKHIFEKIIHAETIIPKIESLNQTYKRDVVTLAELKRISRIMIKQNKPTDPDLLKLFQIESSDIQTGVQCPKCSANPMNYYWGKWTCPSCCATVKNAHISALHDYALLFGTTITNGKMKEFLQMPTIFATSKMLATLNLQHSGAFKHRRYELPPSLK